MTAPETRNNRIADSLKTYGRQLLRFVQGKTARDEDAEDIWQEVWAQFSQITNLDEIGSISGWLYRVARNKIADLYRRRRPEWLEETGPMLEDDESGIREILLANTDRQPEMKPFKNMFWKALQAALDELPANQREVFIRHEIDGISLKQIAEESNENIKTIISRKGYAVKHLRARLQYLYQELNA